MIDPAVSAPAGFVPLEAVGFSGPGDVATAVNEGAPLPVSLRGTAVDYLDRSGTLAVAGAAQQIAPANPDRRGFFVQNVSSADLWISSTGIAVAGAPALRIGPGQLYEAPAHGVPRAVLSIIGAVAGQSFSAREW